LFMRMRLCSHQPLFEHISFQTLRTKHSKLADTRHVDGEFRDRVTLFGSSFCIVCKLT
jgi:hypothetical protein